MAIVTVARDPKDDSHVTTTGGTNMGNVKKLFENNLWLADGIYDVSDIQFMYMNDSYYHPEQLPAHAIDFINKHPQAILASAYETDGTFILSERPRLLGPVAIGSGFNYGSTNVISIPRGVEKVLILAEND